MIDKFREQVNGQHAPEELINSTIEKLHKPRKAKAFVAGVIATGAIVLAVLTMLFIILRPNNVMNYNSISEVSMKDLPQNEQIISEYKSVGGLKVMIRSSQTEEVAPESLISGEKTDIKGYEVFLGINNVNNTYLAAFNKDDINYFIFARGGDKEEFEAYLKEFLK